MSGISGSRMKVTSSWNNMPALVHPCDKHVSRTAPMGDQKGVNGDAMNITEVFSEGGRDGFDFLIDLFVFEN